MARRSRTPSTQFAALIFTPLEVYHAVREIRRGKGMLLVPGDPDARSAGSFFKNPIILSQQMEDLAHDLNLSPADIPHWPAHSLGTGPRVKLAAAWIIERAGFHKGFTFGQAGISSRHTLALINRGQATHADIIALRDHICSTVQRRFDITLEQEPAEVGS